jgi:type VI secretion system protein ImpL
MARLNERLYGRLDGERDERRRVRIFAFPQQMAALKDPLVEWVTDVFGSTRFDKQVLLRGVYFTSGTQEGTPIDRLLGRSGASSPSRRCGGCGRGKAYFVQRMLRDVLFGESGLAGLNWRLEARKAAGQLGLYAALALGAVLAVALLTISYRRNVTYIEEVGTETARLQQTPAPELAARSSRCCPASTCCSR